MGLLLYYVFGGLQAILSQNITQLDLYKCNSQSEPASVLEHSDPDTVGSQLAA